MRGKNNLDVTCDKKIKHQNKKKGIIQKSNYELNLINSMCIVYLYKYDFKISKSKRIIHSNFHGKSIMEVLILGVRMYFVHSSKKRANQLKIPSICTIKNWCG